MENLKKNPLSLQLNVEDFAPASNDEKKSLVVMRESVNFWKDGMRRLRKNKIAMVSLVVILLIAFMAYVLPSFCRPCGPTAMSSRSRAATTWPRLSILPPSRSSSTRARTYSPTFWAPTVWAVTLPCVS